MPELPEVETTRRGIEKHIDGHEIRHIKIREHRLRWPVPKKLSKTLPGSTICKIDRRGKYLLLELDRTPTEYLIFHLGMSGSLRITSPSTPFDRHDHIDIAFNNDKILRFRDPRKFGCLLWTNAPITQHPLLKNMGPEPLGTDFDGDYLYRKSRKRRCNIKALIMNSQVVPGVGNIYASESLFQAGINPQREAGRLTRKHIEHLVDAIKQVLSRAITQGGTTLRDFSREDGTPGYFSQELAVYGRADQPCHSCRRPVQLIKQQQRATYYCKHCQK